MKTYGGTSGFFKDPGTCIICRMSVIDCAIFGYHEGELKLLLVKNKIITDWCLPGGFIKREEGLDEAAGRISKERTGIKNLFLKQFKTFGDPDRNGYRNFDRKKFFKINRY